MVLEPTFKPRSYRRKPKTEVPSVKEWKKEWELTHTRPLPIGNPYSIQPLHYYAKQRMFQQKKSERTLGETVSRSIQTSGDMLPHLSRRQIQRLGVKGLARLHPITSAVMFAQDVKTLYDLLK